VTTADSARGDDTITHPGDHPAYNVEVEPHLLLGWDDVYAEGGWGLGVRFGIPIVDNGFVTTINNSVAISFGGDILHYDNCWYNGPCSANYIDIPVDLQWNFYVARRFTAFGELGLDVYHGFCADCPNGPTCPRGPEAMLVDRARDPTYASAPVTTLPPMICWEITPGSTPTAASIVCP
jgi:hypothetical protein